jgi:signal transduction histidine kinase
LIVLLPCALYFSTFSAIETFNRIVLGAIEAQAVASRDAFGLLLQRDFPSKDSMDKDQLQRDIAALTETGTDDEEEQKLENIRIIIKEGKDYKTIVAQNPGDVGKPINTDPSLNGETLIAYAWANATRDWGAEIEQNGKKYFRIIKPFIDPLTNEVYALVVADISTDRIDSEVASAIFRAYAILIIVILLSLFLVFQHTRLFSYMQLSRELAQKNKAKDNFIRMATHELRSPVSVLNMYMETLKEELSGVVNNDQKIMIERALLSIRNLNDLMTDILEVSHIQQGRMDFKPEKIKPAVAIKEIIEGVQRKASEKNLTLVFEGENFPYNISVNQVCFKRIIYNLVENSIKYTPAGKITVSVKAETSKKRCVITVQDTGFGISAEGQARLFEQFYRVKTKETEEIPGTGLGLWMSREMARRMGGDIMLESIEHIGSRFFVTFPLSD